MIELIWLAGSGGLLVSGLSVWRAGTSARFQASLVAYGLRFPRGLKPEQVTAFATSLAGLAPSRWQRWSAARGVVFEVTASASGIGHRLLVPGDQAQTVLSALRAQLPAVRVSRLDEVPPVGRFTTAAQLGLSNATRPLSTDGAVAVTTGILSSLQPLPEDAQVLLQWVVEPTGPIRAMDAGRLGRSWWGTQQPVDASSKSAARVKASQASFTVTPRIGVRAASTATARSVLRRVLAAFHAANAPGVQLFRRLLPDPLVARNLAGRRLPTLVPGCLLNAAELAMLVGVPTGQVAVAGLPLGMARLLAPSSEIPSRGRVVAMATFPGAERALALSVEDSQRHLHVIGPTGVGKSTLLLGLITQDMTAGHGVIVIDPKGDLARDVLDRVPPHRTDDVIVLDPSDEERPVGLNLLASSADSRELVVDQLVGTLHNLFAAFWGPRTDDILRASLLTLVGRPEMTLCEVPLLLTDQAFRQRLVGQLDEPVALEPFWAWFESLSDAERAQAIGPVLNKLRAFLLRRRLRLILGQAAPPLDLAEVLREGRILIVPLAKGVLGEEGAALLGSLLVARLWQAVTARGAGPTQRRPVFCYLDEFQDFLRLPTNLADVLAQARGLGLGLTLAHQHLGQLPKALREDVLANARSRVIFQSAATDAQRLGREVAPYLTAEDLQGLGAYEVALSLSAGGRTMPPVTARTMPAPAPTGRRAAVRERSRLRYGRDHTAVDAAIRTRHRRDSGAGPIGRREMPR